MRSWFKSLLLGALGLLGLGLEAQAAPATPVAPCTTNLDASSGVTIERCSPASASVPLPVQASYNYTNITTDATTVVKASAGVLHSICVGTSAATETITVYDNTAGSGTKISTVTLYASTNPCLVYDVGFATGLTIVTATAAGDLTVSWR